MDKMLALVQETSQIIGPLQTGHYVKIGFGMGFYVPESDYQLAQDLANLTGRVQFIGISKDGKTLLDTRDGLLERDDSIDVCAWIIPARTSK